MIDYEQIVIRLEQIKNETYEYHTAEPIEDLINEIKHDHDLE